MPIALFGATGRTGRLIAAALVAQGHEVVAPGRRPSDVAGVTHVPTDLRDPAAVQAATIGVDAVISALASGPGNPVCSGLAHALAGHEGLRFVTIGGAAVDSQGDAKGTGDRLIGGIMKLVAREMLADRQAGHDLLVASALDWTMLRPPRLVDGPATGRVRLTLDRPASSRITRADLAAAAIAALPDRSHRRRAPFVAEAARGAAP